MLAKFNTKSNFQNLNGKWLEVASARGTRISCTVFSHQFGKNVMIDFTLSELIALDTLPQASDILEAKTNALCQ